MKSIYSITLMGATVVALSISPMVRASETDDRIEDSAKRSYVFKTYLKDDNVNVESKNGAVTLTGLVADESHKSLARETVASLPKVQSVDNRLVVKGEPPAEHSDAWITTKVKTSLMFHRHVSGTETEVNTYKGVVTLKGEADSIAERDLATEYAKDVDHVKEVRNEMTIAKHDKDKGDHKTNRSKGEKIDDASITGQVKTSLFSHRSTSALNTRVETNNGVVTVGGVARSKTERDLVSKLASDVYGVNDVKNQMTIESSKN